MNCRACGRSIPGDSEFCQYCGQSITGEVGVVQHQAQAKRGMSAGVIVAIVICVLVVASIVTAAVLHVMTQGFEVPRAITPSVQYSETSILGGVQFNIEGITYSYVTWSDVTIALTDGTNYADWRPMTGDLDDGVAATRDYGTDTMEPLTVRCEVSDVGGNGYVNLGDYIRIIAIDGTSFSSEITYSFFLVFEQTGENMRAVTSTG
ncbi:MAG: hypothetical protein JSV90_08955 [Methanobacteriota archaeon]|nr:MAG: hypothetical protein JSV90_08955 [Euryarchaeota archaeon]